MMITDDQVDDIVSFCETVRDGLELTTFDDKRTLMEILDVRGKLAIEDGQKVVYINV